MYLRPIQIRGPPLKGRYSHPGLNVSQRSGLKSSASLPKRSSRRCMAYRFQPTVVFAGMKRGDLPSGPPPQGRRVSLIDIRVLDGTTGYRRSAVRSVSDQSRYKFMACPLDHSDAVVRTFVYDILEILHVFDLFERRLLSIQCVHLPPQLHPHIRPLRQDEPKIGEKTGSSVATMMSGSVCLAIVQIYVSRKYK